MSEEEEKLRNDYLSDKHCAYCTHLIPDKRNGRSFYCDKMYSYVSGSQGACNSYEEAGRSTLISDQIYSDQYEFEAEERDCAFCTHLIPDKKNEGRYYCDYLSTYVKGCDSNKTMKCSNFEESGRSNLECEVIRDDSEVLEAHSESLLNKNFCSDCRFFNTDDKKGEGIYTCTKRNQGVSADQEECYMFEKSGRSSLESEKLYDEALEAKKKSEEPKGDSNNFFIKLFFCFLLIILAIIVNKFMK